MGHIFAWEHLPLQNLGLNLLIFSPNVTFFGSGASRKARYGSSCRRWNKKPAPEPKTEYLYHGSCCGGCADLIVKFGLY